MTLKNHRETTRACKANIAGKTILDVPKGTKLVFVDGAGGGYALTKESAIALGAWEHDAHHYYAYVPGHSVFEAILVRGPLSTKSDEWRDTANRWLVTINGQKFDYYTGIGIKEAPTYDRVLENLLLDSEALGQTFENWASEFGYDTDSRKAFAIWESCCENARKLNQAGIDIAAEKQRLEEENN